MKLLYAKIELQKVVSRSFIFNNSRTILSYAQDDKFPESVTLDLDFLNLGSEFLRCKYTFSKKAIFLFECVK